MDKMKTYDNNDYEKMDIHQLKEIAQSYYWQEYREYISETPMTPHERRVLREWVGKCHSVYDAPVSRFLTDLCYPRPFLEAYREEQEIKNALRKKTGNEREEWLKEYMVFETLSKDELELNAAKAATPEMIKDQVRSIRRELLHLWEFIWSEGLGEKAKEFVEEHKDEETPFEW